MKNMISKANYPHQNLKSKQNVALTSNVWGLTAFSSTQPKMGWAQLIKKTRLVTFLVPWWWTQCHIYLSTTKALLSLNQQEGLLKFDQINKLNRSSISLLIRSTFNSKTLPNMPNHIFQLIMFNPSCNLLKPTSPHNLYFMVLYQSFQVSNQSLNKSHKVLLSILRSMSLSSSISSQAKMSCKSCMPTKQTSSERWPLKTMNCQSYMSVTLDGS